MATSLQFEIFRRAYEEEGERYSELESRADFLLGVVTLYLGAIAFGFKEVAEFAKAFAVPPWFFVALGIPLLGSLTCTLAAMVIRDYERPFDPEELIEKLAEASTPMTDEVFLDERIVDIWPSRRTATYAQTMVSRDTSSRLRSCCWLQPSDSSPCSCGYCYDDLIGLSKRLRKEAA